MALFGSVSLVTNIAKGYALADALRIAAGLGFGRVEIASIGGMCEHVRPEEINGEYIAALAGALKREKLEAYAFAGHVDLTLEKGLNDFLKKMELAAGIGCRIINTNAGPVARMGDFRRNIKKVADKAERLGLTVGLESHGDIVGTAKDAAGLFRDINHPLIRMNYDFGNAYYYSGGTISVEEDILYASEFLAYVHIKDIRIDGANARYRPIGEGDLNYPAIFAALGQIYGEKKTRAGGANDDMHEGVNREAGAKHRKGDETRDDRSAGALHCGLEIPVFVSGTLDALSSDTAPIGADEIRRAAEQSMQYMRKSGAI